MKFLFSVTVLLSLSAPAVSADTLAICNVRQGDDLIRSVVIKKWPQTLPEGQMHLTTIVEQAGWVFDFAETFDGLSKVRIGHGTLNFDGSVSYHGWVHGRLPLNYGHNGVVVECFAEGGDEITEHAQD